jgi:micrococcal nuclease
VPSFTSVVVSVLAGGAVLIGGGAAYSAIGGAGPDRARVVEVIDGDTIDVRYDGSEHRVRLLNIDTPETKHPGKAVECLGPEATNALAGMLEVGDIVRLEFDVELHDRYDRELAGVFDDDLFINAELARRGLGIPVLFEPNRKFYDEVVAAYEEGKAAQAGMFSPDLACTFASRTQVYEDAVVALEAQAGAADPEEVMQAADSVVSEGEALLVLLTAPVPGSLDAAGLTAAELDALRVRVDGLTGRAATVSVAAADAIERKAEEAEQKRKADEAAKKKAAEEAEAKKKAAEEAEAKKKAEEEARVAAEAAAAEAQRQAEAAAEAERQAEAQRQAQAAADAEAARQAQEQQQPASQPPSAPVPGAGYTGCRAYIGGPYVDDQGRFYTPIDCDTRQPLIP